VNTYFRSAFVWVPFQIFLPRSDEYEIYGGFPFPGGWLLGGLLLANLLAAHAIRFKVSWKRSGILLIHAGLIVMMLSELITGLFAIEGRLHIDEGKGSNYIQDYHSSELSFTTSLDDKFDQEVVIPQRLLQPGEKASHADLPFEVEVERIFVNSVVVPYLPDDFRNPATAGLGRKWAAIEKDSIEGTQTGGEVDTPSAYVTLKTKDGQNLGTYLVTSHPFFLSSTTPPRYTTFSPQPVVVGDKTYYMALRHKRTYQPYTMHLIKGETIYYQGTERPKSYSSTILLIDPSRNEKREVTISMNNPLRYGGETFFQSGMNGAVIDGRPMTFTVLQVVRNPGWLMPYISCAMVSIGMIIHFGMHLISFLERRAVS
jgi:ResB-like family